MTWRFCLFYSYKQCHSIYENYQIKIKFIYSFIHFFFFFFVKLQNLKNRRILRIRLMKPYKKKIWQPNWQNLSIIFVLYNERGVS